MCTVHTSLLLFFSRALRNDRILHASNEFVYRVLGRKYLRDDTPDLGRAVQDSDALTPIVLLFNNGKFISEIEDDWEFKCTKHTLNEKI